MHQPPPEIVDTHVDGADVREDLTRFLAGLRGCTSNDRHHRRNPTCDIECGCHNTAVEEPTGEVSNQVFAMVDSDPGYPVVDSTVVNAKYPVERNESLGHIDEIRQRVDFGHNASVRLAIGAEIANNT
jgi:hypothetical protein